MVDQLALQLALRNRALGVSVVTTGSTNLSATSAGYARSAGSFVTDGFYPGMEVLPSGFGVNGGRGVVQKVAALLLTIYDGCEVEAEASGRTLTVGFPNVRVFDNLPAVDGTTVLDEGPVRDRPFVIEDFIPATHTLETMARNGIVTETGLYVLKLFVKENVGASALRKYVQALKALFAPGQGITVTDAQAWVSGDVAPFESQIRNDKPGWANITLTIPWVALTTNSLS